MGDRIGWWIELGILPEPFFIFGFGWIRERFGLVHGCAGAEVIRFGGQDSRGSGTGHWRWRIEKCDRQNAEQDPNDGGDDRDSSKEVSGFGAEGALSAHPAEGTGQTTSATLLNEDEQDHEDRRHGQEHGHQKHAEAKLRKQQYHVEALKSETSQPRGLWMTCYGQASTIARNVAAVSDAPPTRAPSISDWPIND